jgi:hypothetical protein
MIDFVCYLIKADFFFFEGKDGCGDDEGFER